MARAGGGGDASLAVEILRLSEFSVLTGFRCTSNQGLLHYRSSTPQRFCSVGRVCLFQSPLKQGKPVCNSTPAGSIKRALIETGTPSNVVLHLARRLKTKLLQGNQEVTLAEIAAAMRWKSVLGAAGTYFDVCLHAGAREVQSASPHCVWRPCLSCSLSRLTHRSEAIPSWQ